MNYAAMRWVDSADCKVKGSARAVLWVIAYHANREGECWMGQRSLAESSGLSRSTVQLALERLFADEVLEALEDSSGPKPERYQIAPGLVEGEAFGSGVVEGSTGANHIVEGSSEVIHNPTASGPTVGPQGLSLGELVDRSGGASGPIRGPNGSLVDRFAEASGPIGTFQIPALTSAKAGMSESQGYKQGSLKAREVQVVGDDSTADAVVADVPVDPKVLDELEHRGLRPRPALAVARPPPDPRPPLSRDEQLVYLDRCIAEEQAQERQERDRAQARADPPATVAHAQPATVDVMAADATVAVAAHAGVAEGHGVASPATIRVGAAIGEVRAVGEVRGHAVTVGQAHEVELAGQVGITDDAAAELTVTDSGTARERLRVVNE
jgi:hypothetical protein